MSLADNYYSYEDHDSASVKVKLYVVDRHDIGGSVLRWSQPIEALSNREYNRKPVTRTVTKLSRWQVECDWPVQKPSSVRFFPLLLYIFGVGDTKVSDCTAGNTRCASVSFHSAVFFSTNLILFLIVVSLRFVKYQWISIVKCKWTGRHGLECSTSRREICKCNVNHPIDCWIFNVNFFFKFMKFEN